jgi:hypothetical protein
MKISQFGKQHMKRNEKRKLVKRALGEYMSSISFRKHDLPAVHAVVYRLGARLAELLPKKPAKRRPLLYPRPIPSRALLKDMWMLDDDAPFDVEF